MVGMLIVTHHGLARAFKETVEMITGKHDFLDSLGFYEGQEPEQFHCRILEQINYLKSRGMEDVIVFVDLFGGTPYNQTITFLKNFDLHVIVGVNLPMLLQIAVTNGQLDTDTVVNMALKNGRDGMFDASNMIHKLQE